MAARNILSFFASTHPQPITTRRVLFAGILFSVGFGGLLLLNSWARYGTTPIDQTTLDWALTLRTDWLTATAQLLTNLLSPVALSVFVLIAGSFWIWKKHDAWRIVLVWGSLGMALFLTSLIKDIVNRPRPDTLFMIPPFELDPAFPSGHAVSAAVLGLTLWYLWYSRRRTTRILIIGGVVAVALTVIGAFCRIYLGYHWLTDVSASVCLAAIVLSTILLIDTLQPTVKASSNGP